MRLLMLGWEYPPWITGGLGPACRGLSRALVRQGVSVRFILPASPGAEAGAFSDQGAAPEPLGPMPLEGVDLQPPRHAAWSPELGFGAPTGWVEVVRLRLPVLFRSVYGGPPEGLGPVTAAAPGQPAADPTLDPTALARLLVAQRLTPPPGAGHPQAPPAAATTHPHPGSHAPQTAAHATPDAHTTGYTHAHPHAGPPLPPDAASRQACYPEDPIAGARAFADAVIQEVAGEQFDLIHAHDWPTFPAALALGRSLGVPVVLHVHSTEQDRSPEAQNLIVRAIESGALQEADAVVAVSGVTRDALVSRYGVLPSRAFVIHNGVEMETAWADVPRLRLDEADRQARTVLFLGRITGQKGPMAFLRACAEVARVHPGARFVMAGEGDLLEPCRAEALRLGIADRVDFPGFIPHDRVSLLLDAADVLVVPSVSEPFGLVVLEAASRAVPVIVSRNAGVAEALNHLIRVDPDNTRDLADKILGVLRHPALREEIRFGARAELLKLSWDSAARNCMELYRGLLPGMGEMR